MPQCQCARAWAALRNYCRASPVGLPVVDIESTFKAVTRDVRIVRKITGMPETRAFTRYVSVSKQLCVLLRDFLRKYWLTCPLPAKNVTGRRPTVSCATAPLTVVLTLGSHGQR